MTGISGRTSRKGHAGGEGLKRNVTIHRSRALIPAAAFGMIVVAKYDKSMKGRDRLSASVDPQLLAAGHAAVADGRAESLSAWVNDALKLKADHDRRMAALDAFVAAFEAEHGQITEDEIAEATRRTRARATVVRAAPRSGKSPKSQGQKA